MLQFIRARSQRWVLAHVKPSHGSLSTGPSVYRGACAEPMWDTTNGADFSLPGGLMSLSISLLDL